ncbi:MAG: class I SAM-dependent methyltransferase [Hyphomicrobiales bacterium]|nr:class I SAM-dependent methyltransferase [Hyphomicrobiales bacterium]MBV8826109.1 class I SAM-dependent methyltransferase [Hyphomicrobiales bacterium]MBV9429192.1 class I SAM-dependent methyltransferase [Bradyrhizobiaceae bacterium]
MTQLFDTYGKEYRDVVQASIDFSGLSYEFVTVAKADIMREVIAARLGPEAKPSALDVGCGIGVLHRYIRDSFARLCAVDVSTACLEQAARANSGVEYRAYTGAELPFATGEFDFAYAICVLHHVPPADWLGFMREMARVIRPGGVLCIIEHNPLNPLTQLSVRRCEFDRDAVLLPAWRTAGLMVQAGLKMVDSRYFLLMPSAAAPARAIERGLARLPFGAQYIAYGTV